jgi:hypothetical protein
LFLEFVLLIEFELFRCWYLVLNGFLIVDTTAVWASALLVGGFETVETELADLWPYLSATGLQKAPERF